jgi:hypothetical protein
MSDLAYELTMQQYRAAIMRAIAHCDLAIAVKATWPLKNAKREIEDAKMYLALARAEAER